MGNSLNKYNRPFWQRVSPNVQDSFDGHLESSNVFSSLRPDICVVGAGPVGLTLAVALARRGTKVVVFESGLNRPDSSHKSCSDAVIENPTTHAEMRLAVARAFGGTSWLWGGRCVPLDPIDFEPRPHVDPAGWPISHRDLHNYYDEAADLIGCERACFDLPVPPEFRPAAGEIDLCLEHWCAEPNVGRRLSRRGLPSNLQIMLNTTVVDLEITSNGDSVAALHVVTSGTDRIRFNSARAYVLACGGLETTRLLLHAQEHNRNLFGGVGGPLGRFYTGHMTGSVARIRFKKPELGRAFDYILAKGRICRRRIVFAHDILQVHQLPNVAFYPVNPLLGNPEHGAGLLSSLFLLLSAPIIGQRLISEAVRQQQLVEKPRYLAHFRNVFSDLPATIAQLAGIAWQRLALGHRKPYLFLQSSNGEYPLDYHGEAAPSADSRVVLDHQRDAMGMRRLRIDLRFSPNDAEAIARSHGVLDSALRRAGLAELVLNTPPDVLADAIMRYTSDGFHQIGLTRMARDAADGVVDPDCKVFDLDNLFIASSSVFRTAGQANPTFSAVALGLRLADHLVSVITCNRIPERVTG